MKSRKQKERKTDLVELEPFVIRRIENSFDVGFALGRKRTIGKDEVEFLEHGLRPLPQLFLENLSACSEPVKA
jgi:hypothetical protein